MSSVRRSPFDQQYLPVFLRKVEENRQLEEAGKTLPPDEKDQLSTLEVLQTHRKINKLLQERLEERSATFQSWDHHTAGVNATISIIGYDFHTKKSSINEGVGVGTPWRWYPWAKVANLQSRCRATTFEALFGKTEGIPLDKWWFALAPTIIVSKAQNAGDVAVQPALLFTFMDLLYVGPGFNLSGPNQGNVVLFFGIGSSLK